MKLKIKVKQKMSDFLKVVGIIFALPVFIVIVVGIILSWWAEGLVIEEILKAFEVNPFLIGFLSLIGAIVLILSIFILAKDIF